MKNDDRPEVNMCGCVDKSIPTLSSICVKDKVLIIKIKFGYRWGTPGFYAEPKPYIYGGGDFALMHSTQCKASWLFIWDGWRNGGTHLNQNCIESGSRLICVRNNPRSSGS